VPPQARAVPIKQAKAAKGVTPSSTAMPLEARVVPSSLVVGLSSNFGGTPTPLLGTAVLDIFAQDLYIFGLNHLQILYLFLQDSIFHIFVPEIK